LEKGGLPGRSQKIRCETLWVKFKTWYKLVKPKSQIQTLTVTKFKKRGDGTAPYFKAKAAETRHLAPFGVLLAQELYDWYQTDHAWHALQCGGARTKLYMQVMLHICVKGLDVTRSIAYTVLVHVRYRCVGRLT